MDSSNDEYGKKLIQQYDIGKAHGKEEMLKEVKEAISDWYNNIQGDIYDNINIEELYQSIQKLK